MYLQITSRCNMKCGHCCYSCASEGSDMSRKVFLKAISLCDETVSIGGGEPTLHPRFWEFLGLAMGKVEYVWLATNGSVTETALALAGLARKGAIACALSLDEWHDPIDPRVVDAFTKGAGKGYGNDRGNDLREIRTQTEDRLVNVGRCDFGGDEEKCPCPSLFVDPSGSIRACGCPDSPTIGNVFDGIDARWADSGAAHAGECHASEEVTSRLEEYDRENDRSVTA